MKPRTDDKPGFDEFYESLLTAIDDAGTLKVSGKEKAHKDLEGAKIRLVYKLPIWKLDVGYLSERG